MNEKYMKIALKEAKKAFKRKEVPVGAIIVKNGKIISKAFNTKENKKIATHHAELIAIQRACKKLKTWRLDDCTLYVTLEPCLMCCGAIIQSRISNIIYGCKSPKFGYATSVMNVFDQSQNNHKPEHVLNLENEECSNLLKSFFKNKRI